MIFDTFSRWLRFHRVTKSRAKYFTHNKSYCPASQTSMKFANVNFMQPLRSKAIRPEIETAMKELMEKYRSVSQKTVRVLTSKGQSRYFANSSLQAATQFQ